MEKSFWTSPQGITMVEGLIAAVSALLGCALNHGSPTGREDLAEKLQAKKDKVDSTREPCVDAVALLDAHISDLGQGFVRRFDLIQGLGCQSLVVDAVYEEVPIKRQHPDELLAQGTIGPYLTEGSAVTEEAADLIALGLGSGESFSISTEIEASAVVALDDKRATNIALRSEQGLTFLSSTETVFRAIGDGRISTADALKERFGDKSQFQIEIRLLCRASGRQLMAVSFPTSIPHLEAAPP